MQKKWLFASMMAGFLWQYHRHRFKTLSCASTHFDLPPLKEQNIRIMTYNLLVRYPSWGGKPVRPRAGTVLALWREMMPDVVCLQEVDHDWFLALQSLDDAYTFVEKWQTGLLRHMTTIVYNTKRMTLIKGGSFAYRHGFLKRNRRICYGVFEHRLTHQRVIVISTHLSLVFKNHEKRNLQTMMKQVQELIDRADFLMKQYQAPLVIGGDLNCKAASPQSRVSDAVEVYEALLHEFQDTKDLIPHCDEQRVRDHLLIKGPFKILRYQRLADDELGAVSDHDPIYIDCLIEE